MSDPISPADSPETVAAREALLPENPTWNLLDIAAILGFVVLALAVVMTVTFLAAHSLPRFQKMSPEELAQNAMLMIPAQTVLYLLLVAFMVQIVRLRNSGNFLAAIKWNIPAARTAVLAVTGGAGLALLSEIFTSLLSRWIPKSLPIDKFFQDTNSAYLLAVFGIMVAPFVEELFFRGFLYPALARRMGVVLSITITSAAFAVLHQGQLAHAWVPLLWLFVVGVVLTTVRARTKSVATTVLIHMGYNATLFTLLFIVTQGFRHMEKAL
jgi:uncharacterized protein